MKTAKNLEGVRGLAHGFFGRQGGVSSGIFDSLNCGLGSGDDLAHVGENRARVAGHVLPGAALVTVHQIHSPRVISVTEPWTPANAPEADALVTNRPNVILGILTADCAPVLFADAQAGVIGAAHAGWKGAFSGVTEETITAMEALGAKRDRIRAAIGPCISQDSYEVGPEFARALLGGDTDNARFFKPGERQGHYHFDLEGYVASRLSRAGVADVARLSTCTYAGGDEFFSFRRTTHRKETGYGRQISTIALI